MPIELLTTVPSGGDFFKATDHIASLAFLVEVKEHLVDVETKFGKKDMIVADVTEFLNTGMLNGDEPPIIHTRTRLQGGGIVNSLKDNVGKALVCKMVMVSNPKPGFKDFPSFVTADPAAVEGVVKYVEKREAAEKEALSDLPDFLS